jgi:predicted restriction endonuclease
MTNEEILKKAIEKALHNNWEQMLPFVPTWALEQANEDRLTQHIIKTYGKRSIIFSHDFAKAIWGKYEPRCRACGSNPASFDITQQHQHTDFIPAWQYHLQQMVLEEKPLKYLEKFI